MKDLTELEEDVKNWDPHKCEASKDKILAFYCKDGNVYCDYCNEIVEMPI